MFPKNSGTPKSSSLIGFSSINHPFWGTPIFGNTHIFTKSKSSFSKLNINDTIPQTIRHHPSNNATPPPTSFPWNSSFKLTVSDLSGDFWCQQYHPNSLPTAFCNKLPCHLQWSCSGSQHAHRRGHQDNSSTGGTATVCAIVGHGHLRGGHPGWSLGKNPQGVSCRDENLVRYKVPFHIRLKSAKEIVYKKCQKMPKNLWSEFLSLPKQNKTLHLVTFSKHFKLQKQDIAYPQPLTKNKLAKSHSGGSIGIHYDRP